MGSSEPPTHRTLICGGCGKRYRVPATAERKGLKCKDCGSELRLLLDKKQKEQEDRPRAKKVRTSKKNPVPVFVALGVSAVLVIVAIMIWNSGDIDLSGTSEVEEEKPDKRISMADFDEKLSPFEIKLKKMVASFQSYNTDDFPRLLKYQSLYEFIAQKQGERKLWKDLSMNERLNFPDKLRMIEPFTSRWRLARSGEWMTKEATTPENLGKTWVIIPRSFPGGVIEDVWLLLINDSGRPKVVGFKVIEKQKARVVNVDKKFEIPKVEHGADFRKQDKSLRKAALPATTADGEIDEFGHPTSAVKEVPLLENTSPGLIKDIKGHINLLTNPDATRKAQQAKKELIFIGKPAVPILLNHLVGKDLTDPKSVSSAHQVVQALREITGQRFGFEPQIGKETLTAASAIEQRNALRKWFGWWKLNAKTFEAVLTPQMKKEFEKRERWRKKWGK